jgi:hypothetical protein
MAVANGAISQPNLRALRALREDGLSITQIAVRTGLPRSTVGDLLRGSEMLRSCELCGSGFWTGNANRRFCCHQHRVKAANMRLQAREDAARATA